MCRQAWLLHVGAGHQTQTLSAFSGESSPQPTVPDISGIEINLGFFRVFESFGSFRLFVSLSNEMCGPSSLTKASVGAFKAQLVNRSVGRGF